MTTPRQAALDTHPNTDPWGNFLNARLRVIYAMSQQGRSDAYIADALSMNDVQQVTLIRLTAEDYLAKELAGRAAVEQAALGGQNIPTVFPLGSIGASTQPPSTGLRDEDDFAHYFNATARLSKELADARAAAREAQNWLREHGRHEVRCAAGSRMPWRENDRPVCDCGLAVVLPAVVAALKEGK